LEFISGLALERKTISKLDFIVEFLFQWKNILSVPGGYFPSQENQAKGMLEVKRLAVEFNS